MHRPTLTLLCVTTLLTVTQADAPAKRSPREALKPFNDLIGVWRGTGEPEGTREQKQRGFWVESLNWEWQFMGDDAWLVAKFDKSKYFTRAELRALPEPDRYQLKLETVDKKPLVFTGTLADRKLTVERVDDDTKETQRLVVTMLHANRFLYRSEVKPADRPVFARRYQVGATKEGMPFAANASAGPECIVSGGLGTMAVMYKGETYYVCCTGCRDAFKEEPEKYIKEFKEKKAKERDKKPQEK